MYSECWSCYHARTGVVYLVSILCQGLPHPQIPCTVLLRFSHASAVFILRTSYVKSMITRHRICGHYRWLEIGWAEESEGNYFFKSNSLFIYKAVFLWCFGYISSTINKLMKLNSNFHSLHLGLISRVLYNINSKLELELLYPVLPNIIK